MIVHLSNHSTDFVKTLSGPKKKKYQCNLISYFQLAAFMSYFCTIWLKKRIYTNFLKNNLIKYK